MTTPELLQLLGFESLGQDPDARERTQYHLRHAISLSISDNAPLREIALALFEAGIAHERAGTRALFKQLHDRLT